MSSTDVLLAAHATLVHKVRTLQKSRLSLLRDNNYELDFSPIPSPPLTPPDSRSPSPPTGSLNVPRVLPPDLSPQKRARAARYRNYVPEEETIRNDYSQHYVDSGEWPQNWVLGAEPEHRFEEYPKQQRLLAMKKVAVEEVAHPPMFLPMSSLASLSPAKFDVILIDPPFSSSFTWDTLNTMSIPSLASDPSFVFLWVGSGAGDGLERGREMLAKWGYRRAEDIVWIKTNKSTNRGPGFDPPTTSLLTRTKQHCLMGIRGTVRRSTDSWFVHCNIDTDVIVWEGDLKDPMRKPPEMYSLIENFCLGTRRLELFGRPTSLRRGWLTLGEFEPSKEFLQDAGAQAWTRESWEAKTKHANTGKQLVNNTPEIEQLRPKSPVSRANASTSAHNHSNNNNPNLPPNPMQSQMQMPMQNQQGFGGFSGMQTMMPGMMPMGMGMNVPMGMNMNAGMNPMMMGMGMPNMNMGYQFDGNSGGGMPMWMGMQGADPAFMQQMMGGGQTWMGDPTQGWNGG